MLIFLSYQIVRPNCVVYDYKWFHDYAETNIWKYCIVRPTGVPRETSYPLRTAQNEQNNAPRTVPMVPGNCIKDIICI